MALAGKDATIEISADDITYNAVACVRSIDPTLGADLEDVSKIGDDARATLQLLRTHSWTLEVIFDPTDAQQDTIRANCRAGTSFYIRLLFDGTNGYKGQVLCESINTPAAFDGVVFETYTMQNNGDWTILP